MDKHHPVFIQSSYINLCLQRGEYIDAGHDKNSGKNKHYVFFRGLRVHISKCARGENYVHGASWCPIGQRNVKRAKEDYSSMIKKIKNMKAGSRKQCPQIKKCEKKQHLLMGKWDEARL
jgi:hypothetical protein